MAVEPLEKQRIMQMLKEKDTQGTLNWMYTQEGPNAEDYLLGKRVDKHVEGEAQKKQDDVAIFNERVAANIQLDMQAKMREDPLFAIKKKEMEAKKELLNNPVKMKRLQKTLAAQEKEKKKEKKRKKKKSGSDSDSKDLLTSYLSVMAKKTALADEGSSEQGPGRRHRDDDSEDERQNHLRKPRSNDRHPRNRGGAGRRHGSEDSDDGNNDDRRRRGRDEEGSRPEARQYGLLGAHARQRSDSDSPPHRQRDSSQASRYKRKQEDSQSPPHRQRHSPEPSRYKRKQGDSQSPPQQRHRSRSPVQKHRSHQKSRRSRSPQPKHHRSRSPSEKGRSGHRSSGSPRPKKHRSRSPKLRSSPSPARSKNKYRRQSRSRSRSPKRQRASSPPKRKMTDEERQRKLEEMMDNARWRDNQRKTNVQRYEAEAQKEEKSLMQRGEAKFISSMMSEHASQSSVEDRIKRNKYNIQRTNASLSKNFTKL